MSTTLGAATKLLDEMMMNYSQWHTERSPIGKKVNSIEEISSLNEKVDLIMSLLTKQAPIDPYGSFKFLGFSRASRCELYL